MSEYNDKMELTVKFCADKNFLMSDNYDKYLLQKYIAKGIQGAFKLIGSDCNNFMEVYLRTAEQTLAFDNKEEKVGEWIITAKFSDCVYAQCDQCKTTQVFYYNKPLTNFCPHCDARMRNCNEERVSND